MSKKGSISLPADIVFINGFEYKLVQSPYHSDVHGETNKSSKQIIFKPEDNAEVLVDTFVHENLHGLFEDIMDAVDAQEKVHEKEESVVRLLTPRVVEWLCRNKNWIKWIWKKRNY